MRSELGARGAGVAGYAFRRPLAGTMLAERPGVRRPDAATDDEIYSPPPTHPVLVLVALVVLGVGTMSALAWVGSVMSDDEGAGALEQVEVSDVLGLRQDEASLELSDAGFEVAVRVVPNVAVESGVVFEQDPIGGVLTEEGALVTLTISAGEGFVPVPQVTGSTRDEVELQLFSYGLALGEVVTREDLTSLAGEVLEQNPAPGDEVAVGSRVDLVVSDGPPPVAIPDVRGLTEAEATLTLTGLGFTVSPVRVYSGARFGTVVSTTPTREVEADYGSTVRIFVSRGSPPPTAPPPTEPSEPAPAEPTTPSSTPQPRGGGGGGTGGASGAGQGQGAGNGTGTGDG